MSPKQRWAILASLLGATLLAAYLVDDEAAPEKPKRKASVATRSAASSAAADVRRDSRNAPGSELASAPLSFPEPASAEGDGERKVIDPFRSKSWYVAPPPPPPPKPTAPPLPFQYLGKLKEDDGIRVFLNQQGKHIIAKVGDVIDGVYSVEDISGGQMTLLYLPLKEKQILAIGSDK
ncbi:MAG: putative proline-rich transrane protein [Proteobacteria bacterium]|nr:putative proline-rich transrane protein [Pseudomonadota bacterium]